MSAQTSIPSWVEDLQSRGRYTFTRKEAEAGTGFAPASTMAALRRMREKGKLVAPRRGFYVIVPPEYRVTGSPPASWFIDDLMRHLRQPYYVGLLSAAAIHGAAHQQPMIFQVVTDRPTREARAGRVTIRFSMSRSVDRMPALNVQTETGSMRVATPETTAFDLVRYPAGAGHLNNTARVLVDLAERMNSRRLVEVADLVRQPDVQRLGYLLDATGAVALADGLARWLAGRRPRAVLLQPGKRVEGAVDNRWHIVPNVELDLELYFRR